jgi:glycosyltransferase involved in cell wall biosynthesis
MTAESSIAHDPSPPLAAPARRGGVKPKVRATGGGQRGHVRRQATTVRRTMRILLFSTLYPNAVRPDHGIFVETRLRHLIAGGNVAAKVLAPVPWFPSGDPRWGAWADWGRVARREVRHGIEIRHPRYPALPRIGMAIQPFALAAAAWRALAAWRRDGLAFDLIDAHFLYPDGVAAALVARRLGVPYAMTGRGTDLNLYPRFAWPRRWMAWAARRADGLATVCAALKPPLVELGVAADRVRVLRNGVDLALFRPLDRDAARREFAVDGPAIASVGHLIARKGHDFAIRALASLPGWTLFVVGDGPERAALSALSAEAGVADRVVFTGRLGQGTLARLYNAVDMLVLASDREGWANVLLEAMACGTPVVATRIWGTPEIVDGPAAGVLVARDDADILRGIRALAAAPPDRAATRRHAEAFSWDATTRGQEALFAEMLARRR